MHDEYTWETLLSGILPFLNRHPQYGWSLGGGTALYITLSHRLSKDIDLFFTNANVLRDFAPSRNPALRDICDSFQQPGHFIKLEVRDVGEIDFLVAREFHDFPTFDFDFRGQSIRVETPEEIISKKLYFRASVFTIRDIFDLAACSTLIENFAKKIHSDVIDKIPLAVDIIKRKADAFQKHILDEVVPLDVEDNILQHGPEIAVSTLESCLAGADSLQPKTV